MKAMSFAFRFLFIILSLHVVGCSTNQSAIDKFGTPSANADDNNNGNNSGDNTTPPPPSNPPPQISPAPAKPTIKVTLNPGDYIATVFTPDEQALLDEAHQAYAQELGVTKTKVKNAWDNWMQGVLPSQVTDNQTNINHFFQFVIQVDNHLKPYFDSAAQKNNDTHSSFAYGYCESSHNKLVEFHDRLGQLEGKTNSMQNRLHHVSEIYAIGLKKVSSPSETKAKNPDFIGKVIDYVSQVDDDPLLKEVLTEDLEGLLRSASLKYGPQNNKSYVSFLTFYFKDDPNDLFQCPEGCETNKQVRYEGINVNQVKIVADGLGCL